MANPYYGSYYRPSPLAGLPEAAGTLANAIIKSREQQALNSDLGLIGTAIAKAQGGPIGGQEASPYTTPGTPETTGYGQESGDPYSIPGTPATTNYSKETPAQQPDVQQLFAETMQNLKTPQGRMMAVKMFMDHAPKPIYSMVNGKLVQTGTMPRNAEILKPDPTAIEDKKQAGREKLQQMREGLQIKIQAMRDNRLNRQLTAMEERQLRSFENQAKLLDKRLEAQKNKPLTTSQERANAEIDEARVTLDQKGLSKEDILKATQSTLSTGRDNPNFNPAIAKLVNTSRRRKYGDDPDFSKYAWLPTLGKGGGNGRGEVDLSGFKGPGRYKINGKIVAVRSLEDFKNFMGK